MLDISTWDLVSSSSLVSLIVLQATSANDVDGTAVDDSSMSCAIWELGQSSLS
jgi:hypothetical protein